MEPVPLYWSDPEVLTSSVSLVSAEPAAGEPDGWNLVVRDSPYFPGGGGQRSDRGWVNGRRILEAGRVAGGVVLRVEGSGPFDLNDPVRVEVDGIHRLQSRQQHSGQHLVSAALAAEGLDTLAVHLGADYCGIEVNTDRLPDGVIDRVLNLCDRIISEDRPVDSLILTPAELAGVQLRRPLSAGLDAGDEDYSGMVRVVAIRDFDAVGCGGVHLDRTSRIRIVLYDGAERLRGHLRLRFLIGDQAAGRCRLLTGQSRLLQGILSVPFDALAERAGELVTELKSARSALLSSEREIGALAVRLTLENHERRSAPESVMPVTSGQAAGQKSDPTLSLPESSRPADSQPTGLAAMEVPGGAEALEGALDAIRNTSVTTMFLAGRAGEDGGAPWVLYHSGGEGLFEEFRRLFLPLVGGRGGGRPPVMRGRMAVPPAIAVAEFRQLYMVPHTEGSSERLNPPQ